MVQLPRDKHDIAAVNSLLSAGKPELIPHLLTLLTWLQDINWPVSSKLIPVLTKFEPELIPHIKHVLSGNDSIWKYTLLVHLLPKMSMDSVLMLRDEIYQLATEPTSDDISEEVRMAAKHVLASQSWPPSK